MASEAGCWVALQAVAALCLQRAAATRHTPHPCWAHPAGDGGVIKTVVAEGSGWAKPQARDDVCVRFSARVQGATEPFYTSSQEGEVFSLEQGHFCKALGTGGLGWAALNVLSGEGCFACLHARCGLPAPCLGAACSSAHHAQLPTTLVKRSPPPPATCPAAAATMKKEEQARLVVKPECELTEKNKRRKRKGLPLPALSAAGTATAAAAAAAANPRFRLSRCRRLWPGGAGRRGAAGGHAGD